MLQNKERKNLRENKDTGKIAMISTGPYGYLGARAFPFSARCAIQARILPAIRSKRYQPGISLSDHLPAGSDLASHGAVDVANNP